MYDSKKHRAVTSTSQLQILGIVVVREKVDLPRSWKKLFLIGQSANMVVAWGLELVGESNPAKLQGYQMKRPTVVVF